MKRKLIITFLTIITVVPLSAQTAQQDLKREVTLYNPYQPSLAPARKRSFLPDMNDTSRIRPDFKYDIAIKPFMPEYTISPIKAASLLPDPLPKLYKSFINIGLGNYITPFAEISITNERSKKGAVGLYARHFSTNGKVKLLNGEKGFAGYMDNDVSLFGRKFFRNNFVEGSVDYSQKTRYAYGYDTLITGYEPDKKDIRFGYNNLSAAVSLASLTLDSAKFSYDFDADYDFFFSSGTLYQHNAGLKGTMATLFKGFYAGSDLKLDFFIPASTELKYIISLSPFVKKSTSQWNFKAGFEALLDKNMSDKPAFHLYPDVRFGFSVVPEYVGFFAALNGKLEVNEPEVVIEQNPFLVNDGSLYTLTNTDHALIVSAGLKGNNGIGGNYVFSASYSMINSILFFSNYTSPFGAINAETGNHFIPLYDDGEILNVHGEMSGMITDKVTYGASANFYKYTLTNYDHAWNKPAWDGKLGIKYNLRDKIIAGLDIAAVSKRYLTTARFDAVDGLSTLNFKEPVHVNFNLSAEYRYTKILSFWLKLNNIAFNRYNEWAYYPTQRFIGLVGFTYSL